MCEIPLVTRLFKDRTQQSNISISSPSISKLVSVTERSNMTEPFYKIPKSLFTDEQYRNISTDAKILFALLLDRQSLSASNGCIDNRGRVYQYFTIQNAGELLHFGHEKICKLFAELECSGLITRKRQGQGKPSIIYVNTDFRKSKLPYNRN